MSLKDTIDFSDFVTSTEAGELEAQATRKTFEYDSYAKQTRFVAVVLSEPLPFRAEDVKHFTNVPESTFLDRVRGALGLSGPDQRRISKFTFKARIVGHNSPHWFLPDPCDPAYSGADADSRARNLKLIAMHTLFTSTETYQLQAGKKLPNRGDLVLVELDYNDFSYNLQAGTFIDVMQATDAYHNIENYVGESCAVSLAGAFTGGPSVGGTPGAPGIGPCNSSYAGPATTPWAGTPSTAADIDAAYPEIAAVSGWSQKIVSVCSSLGIPDPAWLANVMYFETARTLNPAIVNSIGCGGLIQFCPTTGAVTVGKTVAQLTAMGAVAQMNYVESYLRSANSSGTYNAPIDLYMTIFFPVAIGKPNCQFPAWAVAANNGINTPSEYARRADATARIIV